MSFGQQTFQPIPNTAYAFTFQIHRIEAKKHKKDEGAPGQNTVIESEVGLHVEHEQERINEGVIYRASDMAMVDIAMTAATRPKEQLASPPIQPNPHGRAAHHHILPFLTKGPQARHKT